MIPLEHNRTSDGGTTRRCHTQSAQRIRLQLLPPSVLQIQSEPETLILPPQALSPTCIRL